jgi:LPXTG-site transpeptidase (sortase) family protein
VAAGLVAAGLALAGSALLVGLPDGDPGPQGPRSPARTAEPFVVAPAERLTARPDVAPSHDAPGPGAPSPGPPPGRPLAVVIPALDVRAPVVPISGSTGVLRPPDDARTLGWWSGGAKPGARRGSAVVTGHTVHTGGGVFDDLGRLAPGDRIRVRTTRGLLGYVVRATTVYAKSSLASDAGRVFSQAVPGRLVLVTCEDWNGYEYLSNTVVLADRVSG